MGRGGTGGGYDRERRAVERGERDRGKRGAMGREGGGEEGGEGETWKQGLGLRVEGLGCREKGLRRDLEAKLVEDMQHALIGGRRAVVLWFRV